MDASDADDVGPSHRRHTLCSSAKKRPPLPRAAKQKKQQNSPAKKRKAPPKSTARVNTRNATAAAGSPRRIATGIRKKNARPSSPVHRAKSAVRRAESEADGEETSTSTSSITSAPHKRLLPRALLFKAVHTQLATTPSSSSRSSDTPTASSSISATPSLVRTPPTVPPSSQLLLKVKRTRFLLPSPLSTPNASDDVAEAILAQVHSLLSKMPKMKPDAVLGEYRPMVMKQLETVLGKAAKTFEVSGEGAVEGQLVKTVPLTSDMMFAVTNVFRSMEGHNLRWEKIGDDEFVGIIDMGCIARAFDATKDGIPGPRGARIPCSYTQMPKPLALPVSSGLHLEMRGLSPALSDDAISTMMHNFGCCVVRVSKDRSFCRVSYSCPKSARTARKLTHRLICYGSAIEIVV